MQRVDRVLTEALERLRMQLVHADQIVTGALDTVEDTGTKLRRSVVGPGESVVAVVRGFRPDGILSRPSGAAQPEPPARTQDESLFI